MESGGNQYLHFHRNPVEIHGIHWKTIEFNGHPLNAVDIHGIRWNSMEFCGNLRNPLEIHRIQ